MAFTKLSLAPWNLGEDSKALGRRPHWRCYWPSDQRPTMWIDEGDRGFRTSPHLSPLQENSRRKWRFATGILMVSGLRIDELQPQKEEPKTSCWCTSQGGAWISTGAPTTRHMMPFWLLLWVRTQNISWWHSGACVVQPRQFCEF